MRRDEYGQAYEVGLPQTKRWLILRGANSSEAEEVAQQAWARGWERVSELRDDARIQGWINVIAVNLLRSMKRGIRSVQLSEIPEPRWKLNLDSAIDLARVLGESSPRDRRLLVEVIAGYCTDELARERNVTNGAMLTQICRARRRLAKRFRVNSVVTENRRVARPSNRKQTTAEKRQVIGELPDSPAAA